MRLRSVSGGFVPLAVLALSCTASDEPRPTPPAPIPEAVQRAFEGSCMHDGCHDAEAQAAGLSLDAADSLAIVGGPSSQSDLPLVELGRLEGSYMAIKLLPDGQLPPGVERHEERMPLDGVESEDVDRINTILAWIAGYGPGGPGGTGGDPTGGEDTGATGTSGSGDDAGSGSSSTGDDPSDSGPDPTGGGPIVPACSVQEVTEGAVTNPLDKGNGAGQIPQEVGEILEARCGCHTLADRELNTKYPALLAPSGSLFLDHADTLVLGTDLNDVMFTEMSMPPGSCPSIPADDLATLEAWFMAGQPDGAEF